MQKDTLRGMNLYVDGKGFAGAIDEINLPKLSIKTEEYRAGGMDAPLEIDMGMEKLETDFTISKFEQSVLVSYGLSPNTQVKLTVRGVVLSQADGSERPFVANMRGLLREMDFGSWKAGDNAPLKVTASLQYYRLSVGDVEIYEIDIINMIRKINGHDQLANTRSILGI